MSVAFDSDDGMLGPMKSHPMLPMLTRWNKRAAVVFGVMLLVTWIVYFVFGLFPFGLGFFAEMAVGSVCVMSLFFSLLTILISPALPHRHRVGAQLGYRFSLAGACIMIAGIVFWAGGGPEHVGARIGGKLGIGLQPLRDLQSCPAVAAFAKSEDELSKELPYEQWPESVKSWRDRPDYIWVSHSASGPPELRLGFGRGARYHGIAVQQTRPDYLSDDTARVVQRADDVWFYRIYGE